MPQARRPPAPRPALRPALRPAPAPRSAPRPVARSAPPRPAPRAQAARPAPRPAAAPRAPQAPRSAPPRQAPRPAAHAQPTRPAGKAAQAHRPGARAPARARHGARRPVARAASPQGAHAPTQAQVSARGLGTFESTAYGPPWNSMQGSGVTATGVDLRPSKHAYIVAVDPSVIALHSKLHITPNPFGNDNIVFSAEDTGGAIKGKHVDFYDWRGRSTQLGWGRRNVTVSVLSGSGLRGIPVIGGVLGAGSVGGSGTSGSPAVPTPSAYVNPLAHARVTAERIDQGVDYAGTGYLVAIADGVVTESVANGSGWEGEGYLEYKITHPGELENVYVYYAEGINPVVHVGERIRAGSRIADLRSPMPHGIELGFAAGAGQESYYRYHDGNYVEGTATRSGIAFSNLIVRLGGPAGRIEGAVVGRFPEYMQSGEPNPAIAPGDTAPVPVGGGVAPLINGQFVWPRDILSAFVQLQRGALNGSHHSHAAWFFARGIQYVPKAD